MPDRFDQRLSADTASFPSTQLRRYHLSHVSRADLLRRSGRAGEATAAYQRALELVTNPVERKYLLERVAQV